MDCGSRNSSLYFVPKTRVRMVELTVFWEKKPDKSHELLNVNYQDLANTCRERGWKIVPCRGELQRIPISIENAGGFNGRARKTTALVLGKAAERASG